MATRELKVELLADPSSLQRAFRTAGREASLLEQKFGKSGAIMHRSFGLASGAVGRLGAAARTASPYLTAGLAAGLIKSVAEAREAEKALAQTQAVIKSTGGEANITAKHLESYAGKLSQLIAVDDEAIQAGGNLLLTFTNIRNELGKGNDVFDQTLGTALDMSAALDQDLKSSIIQVGKALNDPITGLTALRRVGVAFSDDQVKVITRLTETGELMKAQKLVLAELNKEFAGSAKAQADPLDRLRVTFDNLAESAGQKLLPELNRVADEVDSILTDRSLSGEEKFERLFGMVTEGAEEALEWLSDHADDFALAGGKIAVKFGEAFVKGFLEAPILGKVFLGGALIRALGGPGAIGKVGSSIGGLILRGVGTGGAASTVAGKVGGALTQPGYTPARPLFVTVVGPGGLGGAPIPGGGRGTLGKVGRGLMTAGRWAGPAAIAIAPAVGAYLGTEAVREKRFVSAWDVYLEDLKNYRQIARQWSEEERDLLAERIRTARRAGDITAQEAQRLLGALGDSRFARSIDRLKQQYGSLQDAAAAMSRGQRKAWVESAQAAAEKGLISQRAADKLADEFDDAERRIDSAWKRIGRVTGRSAEDVKRETGSLAKDFIKSIAGMEGATAQGMAVIADDTNAALRAFGVAEIKWAVKSRREGLQPQARAKGGRIFSDGGILPGYSTVDNVPALLRSGEAVLTPEVHLPWADRAFAVARAAGAVPFGSVDEMFARTGAARYAKGGSAGNAGSVSLRNALSVDARTSALNLHFTPHFQFGGKVPAQRQGLRSLTINEQLTLQIQPSGAARPNVPRIEIGGSGVSDVPRFGKGGGKRPRYAGPWASILKPAGTGKVKFDPQVGRTPGLSYEDLLVINDIALSNAGQTETTADDLAALAARQSLVADRKAYIERQLAKKRVSPEKRSDLLQDLSSLTSELNSTVEQIRQAQEDQRRAIEENTAAHLAAAEATLAQVKLMAEELAVGIVEARRFMADLLAGEIGGRMVQHSFNAGAGSVTRD